MADYSEKKPLESVADFDSIYGQDRPVQLLASLFQRSVVPHAFLFTGVDGIGKRTVALLFAMLLNCRAVKDRLEVGEAVSLNPCGECRSCRKIRSGNHPDILLIEPEKNLIKIDRIREVCQNLGMKPYEGLRRVVIISDAMLMNKEAGNALLKSLEEPPDRTVLILTCSQASDVLPTIVSRCRQVRFNPMADHEIERMLIHRKGVDQKQAMILAALAQGSYGKAAYLASSGAMDWISWRNWLIGQSPAGKDKSVQGWFATAERLSKKKENIIDLLEVLKTWMRDLIIYRYYPTKVINRDLMDDIALESKTLDVSTLVHSINEISVAQKRIKGNANLRLTLEALFIKIGNTSK